MPIFAKDKSTNEDMNRTEAINNSLNMRGLQEITPPYLWKLCKQQVPKGGKTFTCPAASGLRLLRQGFLVFVAKSCAERRNAY